MFKWDHEKFLASLSPVERRKHKRNLQVFKTFMWMQMHFPWLSWPILHVVYTFWYAIFDEGVRSTLNPSWGAMTFSYLNDGIHPTLWHTLYMVLNHPRAKYSGIYAGGAPSSRKNAESRDAK